MRYVQAVENTRPVWVTSSTLQFREAELSMQCLGDLNSDFTAHQSITTYERRWIMPQYAR